MGIELFITIIILVLLFNFFNNMKVLSKPKRKRLSEDTPLISILVPARNEEDNIEPCLLSLLHQDYPNTEVIVLDDNSSDRTTEIIESLISKYPKLKLIYGRSLPEGWTGKNFACHQLAFYSRGDWLLFTDADTIHSPYSVSSVFNAVKDSDIDLLSLIPHIRAETFAEKLFMPLIPFAFLVFLPIGLMNRVKDFRVTAAIGPFILIKRDFYFKIGGHKAIKDKLLDDFCLAQLTKLSGGRVSLLDGSEIVSVRFYKNLKEIWNGFSKNAFGAIGGSLPTLLTFLFINILVFILPYYLLWEGIFKGHSINLPLLQVLLISLIRGIISLRFRTNFLMIFLHPVSMIFGIVIALNSARIALLKKVVEWKGRFYPVMEG